MREPATPLFGTHYEVLGIAFGASPETVEIAYRQACNLRGTWFGRLRLAIERGCTATSLAQAYRVLSDPQARRLYDASARQRQRELVLPFPPS